MNRNGFLRRILCIWLVTVVLGSCGCAQHVVTQQEDTPEQVQADSISSASIPNSESNRETDSRESVANSNTLQDSSKEDAQDKSNGWQSSDEEQLSFQQRIMQANSVEELKLTGLSFQERCQLIMQRIGGDRWNCFGLVDLTQDGCPEFYSEIYGMGVSYRFYDITGEYPRKVLAFSTGSPDENGKYFIWHNEDTLLQGGNWQIYSTLFSDGTFGGIIEQAGKYRSYETLYFTDDGGEYPLDRCLIVAAEEGEWYPGEGSVVWYSLDCKNGTRREALTDNRNPIIWEYEEVSETDFLASVQDTWLGKLRALPRSPWISPVVCTEEHDDWLLPGEIEKYAQYLMDEYNRQLEEGDYDLPLVS